MEMQELLKSFIKKNEIVSVFCKPEDSYGSVVGFVAQVDTDYFIINEVSTDGLYDGYVLRKTDDVFRIDYDSYYESSLLKLFAHKKQCHLEVPENESVLTGFLKFAKESNFVVSVGIRDRDSNSVTGYIDSYDVESETVTFHTITMEKEGAFDGFTSTTFDSIMRMCCDTEKDRAYQMLNDLCIGDR